MREDRNGARVDGRESKSGFVRLGIMRTGWTGPNSGPSGGEILSPGPGNGLVRGHMHERVGLRAVFFSGRGFPAQASNVAWCAEAQCVSGP
jgi:hypothetical protein